MIAAEIELMQFDMIAAMPEAWAGAMFAAETAGRSRDRQRKTNPTTTYQGRVAVINLYGILTQRTGILAALGLGTGLDRVSCAIDEATADDFTDAIILNVDSGGGSVYGVRELAAKIRQTRERVPIIAVANSLAASAAYWIASQASEVYVTPGGEVGSIGVFVQHQDVSKALGQAGIKISVVSAGKHKTELSEFCALSPSAKAFQQQKVDRTLASFHEDVAKGRKTSAARVASTYGQGRVHGASSALQAGMVDSIQTLDQVIRRWNRLA